MIHTLPHLQGQGPDLIVAIITASASIMVAVIAYWLNHRGEKNRLAHQARLDWVNSQLKDLYGPLLVLSETNEKTWKSFRLRYLPPESERLQPTALTEDQETLWSEWATTVFMPAAREMRDRIVARGELIIEDEMPEAILNFCAHVASYEAALSGNESLSPRPLIRHPGDSFASYIRNSYSHLKREQARLTRR